MNRIRLWGLIVIAAAVTAYTALLAWHDHVGWRAAARLQYGSQASSTGIRVSRVDRPGSYSPTAGDWITRIGDISTPTAIHFERAVQQLGRDDGWASATTVLAIGELTSLSNAVSRARFGMRRFVRGHGRLAMQQRGRGGAAVTTSRGLAAGTKEAPLGWLELERNRPRPFWATLAWLATESAVMALASLVVWRRPGDLSAALFLALAAAQLVACWGALHVRVFMATPALGFPFVLCLALLAPLTVNFYAAFPRPGQILRRHPWALLSVPYGVALGVGGWALICVTGVELQLSSDRVEALAQWISRLLPTLEFLVLYTLVLLLGAPLSLMASYRRCRTSAQRRQVSGVVLGGLGVAGPLVLLLTFAVRWPEELTANPAANWSLYSVGLISMVTTAASIGRYRSLDVGRLLNRGILYVGISFVVTVLFCLMVGLLTALVGTYFFRWENALAAGLTAMLVVVFLGWIRDRFQKALDRRFLRQKYQLDNAMRRLGKVVDRLIEPNQLAWQLLVAARDAIGAEQGAVYLREKSADRFALAVRMGALEAPDEIPLDAAVATELKHVPALTSRPGLGTLPTPGQQQLRDWDGELVCALETDGAVFGLVLLGPHPDGAPYTAEDRNFLLALARTTTLALYSARGHRTIEALKEKLQGTVQKMAEQQQRITFLQGELLNRRQTVEGGATRNAAEISDASTAIRGSSPAIRQVLAQIRKVAASQASVLVRGESGTGKELLALAIHRGSSRAAAPFVAVHCAALSPGLLESELFGHVKGAFTGADRDKPGRFELAHGGTLFLDEIGDISLETQTKLLRVLQEKSFERVGGVKRQHVDVRLIAATHQNLEELIRRGRFRQDLFYRLNVISITAPALRNRRGDVFELAVHFLQQAATQAGKRISRIDDAALEALVAHAWPGNVRELENAIERAVVLADSEVIHLSDLPIEILRGADELEKSGVIGVDSPEVRSRPTRRKRNAAAPGIEIEAEREQLMAALAQSAGNKTEAARLLGIPRSTLFSKLRRSGLD